MSNQILPDVRFPVNSPAKIIPARLFCIRCSAPVNRASDEDMERIAGRTWQSCRNCVYILDDNFQPLVAYCSACSSTLRVCSFCGCTDECACPGGCCWVQEDVCSACAPGAHPMAEETEVTSWSGNCHKCGHVWPQTPRQNMCPKCGAGPLCRLPNGAYAIDLVELHPICNGNGEMGDSA